MKRAQNPVKVKPNNTVSLFSSQFMQKYASRIKHAKRRPRHKNGRFYRKDELPPEEPEKSEFNPEKDQVSDKSRDNTKASHE